MTILVKKVFISSKPTFVYLLCPPLCGPFSIQESAAGGLSYKARKKEASRGDSPLPASFSFSYHAIRVFPSKAVFLLHSPYINGAISRIAFPQNLCSAGSASTLSFVIRTHFGSVSSKSFLICSTTGFS